MVKKFSSFLYVYMLMASLGQNVAVQVQPHSATGVTLDNFNIISSKSDINFYFFP